MDVSELHDGEYSNEALRKLGARVRHLRRKRGMTQRDLSFDGCSYSYLARIEAGDRRPSPRVLMEIARRLGVSSEELTGETAPQ
jgi:transcriptional regulator with XRE-family HTH domain